MTGSIVVVPVRPHEPARAQATRPTRTIGDTMVTRPANCTSCRYSQVDHEPDEGFEDGPLLRCHRYPPTVLCIDGEAAQTWPNVGHNDWCGEHTEDDR